MLRMLVGQKGRGAWVLGVQVSVWSSGCTHPSRSHHTHSSPLAFPALPTNLTSHGPGRWALIPLSIGYQP